jgi:hypothetical protein
MTGFLAVLAAVAPLAAFEVEAGGDVAAALERARPGDVVRLAGGTHRARLVVPDGVRLEGAGPGSTRVVAPEGEDAVLASGRAELRSLSLQAGRARAALRVTSGEVVLDSVTLAGGAAGAAISGGRLRGARVALSGEVGLAVDGGEISLEDATIRGSAAGVLLRDGALGLRRTAVTGPFREAALTASGGTVRLDAVVVRAPGPAGIAVEGGASVEGTGVVIAGDGRTDGFPGACVTVRRGKVALSGSTLLRCGGAAVSTARGEVRLEGVDLAGGAAGGLVLDGGVADLEGNLVAGGGPGLVATSGARVLARMNRWWTDPVFWVDCGSGARVELGPGEHGTAPCVGSP